MSQHPMPVVVISSSENRVLEALESGAVDFISKPQVSTPDHLTVFINEIIKKIKIAAVSHPGGVHK